MGLKPCRAVVAEGVGSQLEGIFSATLVKASGRSRRRGSNMERGMQQQ